VLHIIDVIKSEKGLKKFKIIIWCHDISTKPNLKFVSQGHDFLSKKSSFIY
jgi:hypothetical protein